MTRRPFLLVVPMLANVIPLLKAPQGAGWSFKERPTSPASETYARSPLDSIVDQQARTNSRFRHHWSYKMSSQIFGHRIHS
jgi:hypothetical protein